MILRIVAEIPEPDDHPEEARDADDDERAAPADERHDGHHHDRGERIAEPRERVRDALREAAAAGLDPMLHGARRGRQRRADAKAHQHAPEEERGEPGGEAGQDGRARPDEAGDEERLARAEFVGGHAADDLEQQIGIGEGGEDEAGIGRGQAELGPDLQHLRRDALAHDVRDEIHRAQEDEHDIGGLEHTLHDGLLPECDELEHDPNRRQTQLAEFLPPAPRARVPRTGLPALGDVKLSRSSAGLICSCVSPASGRQSFGYSAALWSGAFAVEPR